MGGNLGGVDGEKGVNRAQFAELMGLSTAHVDRLVSDGVITKRFKKGGNTWRYGIECAGEYIRHRLRKEPEPDVVTAQSRMEEARAAKAELELARLQGEVVPRDEVHTAWKTAMDQLANAIKSMPPRVGPTLVGIEDDVEGMERMEDAAAELMAAMTQWSPNGKATHR